MRDLCAHGRNVAPNGDRPAPRRYFLHNALKSSAIASKGSARTSFSG
jgi:hypothetical protein